MATYIQGLTDYIPQIQPFQPDLNFFANVMQTKQTKYDAAKKKVNDLYGSLLYSPMSREDNIKRREEFFKVINGDIQRIAGLDLSRQENLDQALNVFQGFYDDQNMVHDMVTTKKFNSQLQKAESLKGCVDADKCGGLYWDAGVKKMQYQMEKYKNLSANEAVNFKLDSYDSYVPWQEKAMKLVMDKGFNAEKDTVSGQWIVTDKNGKLIKDGLLGVFKSVYGNDPRIEENYRTMSYVDIEDNIRNGINIHGSREASEQAYATKVFNQGLEDINKKYKYVSDNYAQVNNRILELEKKKEKTGKLSKEDEAAYQEAFSTKEVLSQYKTNYEDRLKSLTADQKQGDVKSIINKAIIANASALEFKDMDSLAENLSKRGETRTIKANPYGEISARSAAQKSELAFASKLRKDEAAYNFAIDLERMEVEHGYDVSLKEIEGGVKNGTLPSPAGDFTTGATEVEATPGSTVSYDLKETPEMMYQRTRREAFASEADSKNGALSYLYEVFTKAKNSNAPGAKQYLKDNFGDNWNKITDPKSLERNIKKGNYYQLFNNTLTQLDQKKNPAGDTDWAQDFVGGSKAKEVAYHVKKGHDAYVAKMVNALDANKKVVNLIKSKATEDNKAAKYADLLLTKSGSFIGHNEDAPKSFIEDYIKREYAAGNYDADASDAQDVYEALQDQFYITYNTTSKTFNTGAGLSGQGIISARGLNYSALNLKTRTGPSADVVSTINEAISNPGGAKIVIGSSNDRETYEDTDQDETAKMVLEALVRKVNSTDKDKPTISALLSAIAAEKENVGSMSLKLPKDFLEEVLGSKEKGDLAVKRDKILADGITLFFNKDMIKSNIIEATKMTNTETILRSGKDVDIDVFSDYGGTVRFTDYDERSGTVKVVTDKKVVRNGELVTESLSPKTISISDISTSEQMMLEGLRLASESNKKLLNK